MGVTEGESQNKKKSKNKENLSTREKLRKGFWESMKEFKNINMKFVKGEKNEVHGRGKCHGGSTLSGWIPATDLPCHKTQGACLEL